MSTSSSCDKPVQDIEGLVQVITSKVFRDHPYLWASHKLVLQRVCTYASEAYQEFLFGCVPWVTDIKCIQDLELDVQEIEHLKTIRQSLSRSLEEKQLMDHIIDQLDKDGTCTIPDMIALAECMPKFARDVDVYKFFAVDGLLGKDTTRYVAAYKHDDYRKLHAKAVRKMYVMNITTSPEETKQVLETIFREEWHKARDLYVDTVGGSDNVSRIHRYIRNQQQKLNSLSDYRKRVQVKQHLEDPKAPTTCMNDDIDWDEISSQLLKQMDENSCESSLHVLIEMVAETYQENVFGCCPFVIIPSINKFCQLNPELMYELEMMMTKRTAFITDEDERIFNNVLGKDEILVTDLLDLAGCLYKIAYDLKEVHIYFAVDGTIGYDETRHVDSFKYDPQSVQYRHAEAVRKLYRANMIDSPYDMNKALETIFKGGNHPVKEMYIDFMGGWFNVKRAESWIEKRKKVLAGLEFDARENMYRKRMSTTKTLMESL
ncbi:hypothetical protein JTE90_022651 [Oedothorax gibbosus]|uniref:Uncharacterized protein n=1 Tax=Oedothorax gibbosus TaxID=931172 RepID=A0AAV6TUD2_9ARAC|nr:hypothetical protein JTE90_022651 [Oedothorax gibbosus]